MRFLTVVRSSAFSLLLLCLPVLALQAVSRPDTSTASNGDATPDYLSAFSSASTDWGSGVEAVMEEAFRKCFRTYIVDGKVVTLHLPFGENNERSEMTQGELAIRWGGKGDPLELWDDIDTLLASSDFASYEAALSEGHEQVIVFDLQKTTWTVTRDWFTISRMKSGDYPGLPHRPYVLVSGTGVTLPDIYNYLYSVGRLGVDCAGFVWYELKAIARAGGVDLDRVLGPATGAPRGTNPSLYVGASFFNTRNRYLQTVKDEVGNLQPGDVILFMGEDGVTSHSAIIQSVNMTTGTIRYLQSTDVATPDQRGVHESFISFDPTKPHTSLKDPSIVWHNRRLAPFPGETGVIFYDDGSRYRAYPQLGGGNVVRVKLLQKAIDRLEAAARRSTSSKPGPTPQ